jgi:D-beta-D-heptose 7-phosphate kinase / D-beta-D-heptose 1-phosphate adenosyltransferase
MTDRAALAAALPRLAEACILVVGDVMLDRYVHGEAERLSPEAPVPVLHVRPDRDREMLGGAGNVARNLAALGAACEFVAAIGDDTHGETVRRLAAAERGVSPRLVAVPGRTTALKTRFIAGGQQLLRADREERAPIPPSAESALAAAVAAAAPGAGAVVLSDYGKGVLTPRIVAAVLAAAGGRPVLVDPKQRDYAAYAGAFLVTPNRKELHEAAGLPTGTDDEVAAAARHVQRQARIANVLGTRGPAGMTLVESGGQATHIPAEAREVFDVSGAGDTVIAAVAAGLAAGLALVDAVRLANVAAGIVVGKAGTAVAHPDEIAAALHGGKVMTREQARRVAAAWRQRGLKIGFANGCFDLLHPGHLHLIAAARARCDRLVIGLNSDASVRRLAKAGPPRPAQDEATRAAVLAALADVDLVTVFDEDTPLALIEALAPDLLVKGEDYAETDIVGADFVRRRGGEVLRVALLAGHSTTATLQKLGR